MTQRIFFCRPADAIGDGSTLSDRGKRQLDTVHTRLRKSEFKARCVISSNALIALASARHLVPGIQPAVLPILHAFISQQRITIRGAIAEGIQESLDVYVQHALTEILLVAPDVGDIVVFSHQSIPLYLAYEYHESRRGTVQKTDYDAHFPLEGEGVLVSTKFEMLYNLNFAL